MNAASETGRKNLLERLPLPLVFLFLAALSLRWITDYDFWIHLSVGRLIAQTRAVPPEEILSWTMQGREWLHHGWLAQLLFYGLWQAWGAAGIILFKTGLLAGTFLLVYLFSAPQRDPLLAAFTFFFAGLASGWHFYERPLIFTLLFAAADILLLYRLSRENRFKIWTALILIQILWANVHRGFVLGPVIVSLHFAGRVLSRLFKKEDLSGRGFMEGSLLCLSVFLANALNPSGGKMLIRPFQDVASPVFRKMVVEWFSPFATAVVPGQTFILVFYILLLAWLWGNLILARRNVAVWEWLAAAAFTALSARSIRMIPVLAFVSLPLLLSHGGSAKEKAAALVLGRFPAWRGKIRSVLALLLSLAAAAAAYMVYSNRYYIWQRVPEQFALGVAPAQFPAGAALFLKEHSIPGRGFNTFAEAGYLMWALPEKKVYVDGRSDIYGEPFMVNYWRALEDPALFGALLRDSDIRYVVLPSGLPVSQRLTPYLYGRSDWALVQFDESSLLFVRRDSLPAEDLKRFEIRSGLQGGKEFEPGLSEPALLPGQVVYPRGALKIGVTCELLGEPARALAYYKRAEELCDDLPVEIYYNAGRILLQRGDYAGAADQFEAALHRKAGMAEAHHALGVTRFQLHDYGRAEKHWREALRLDPGMEASRRYLDLLKSIK